MQHTFGKPLHRSTEWRRNKRGGEGRRGRRWAKKSRDEGFLGFAATVISLINKNGSVGYAELFNRSATGEQRSYWKDETTDKIFDQLANSGFPPAMIAVAACMIAKLNKKTGRGAKPVNLMPHELAFRKLEKSDKEITVQNFETALLREKLEVVLKQNHTKKLDRERFMAEAGKSNFKDKWVFDYLRQYKTPADNRAKGSAPMVVSRKDTLEEQVNELDQLSSLSLALKKVSSKSTPAHQVDFLNGAELSRKMVYYWKKHSLFPDCLRFLNGLLTQTRPSARSDKFFQMPYDWYVNSEIVMFGKIRRLEKAGQTLAAASKPKVKPTHR